MKMGPGTLYGSLDRIRVMARSSHLQSSFDQVRRSMRLRSQ